MTTALMLARNRKVMVLRIASGAPWLTHQDIADWVGCSRKHVCHVLNRAGLYR